MHRPHQLTTPMWVVIKLCVSVIRTYFTSHIRTCHGCDEHRSLSRVHTILKRTYILLSLNLRGGTPWRGSSHEWRVYRCKRSVSKVVLKIWIWKRVVIIFVWYLYDGWRIHLTWHIYCFSQCTPQQKGYQVDLWLLLRDDELLQMYFMLVYNYKHTWRPSTV